MGELLASSPLSLFMLPKYRIKSSTLVRGCLLRSSVSSFNSFSKQSVLSTMYYAQEKQLSLGINEHVISSSKLHTIIPAVSSGKENYTPTDNSSVSGGDNDDFGGSGGGNKGDEDKDKSEKGDTPMSMSQKLTLGYAILVVAGGIIGYLKNGSQTSIILGLLSSSILYYVYTLLPSKPVIASAFGFVVSLTLSSIMGSSFKISGKIFPAGIVSFMSIIMTGGYLHGFMRGAH